MKYFYDKETDCFYPEDQTEAIKETFIEYSQEQYDELMNCDWQHYEMQDPETKLPKLFELELEDKKSYLRRLREKECFSITDRGNLWYDNLSEDRKLEIQTWYKAWLNVTDTLVIPVKPERL